MATIEQQIETIQARIAELETMIRPLADEAARLRHDILRLKSQFNEGDIISWKSGEHTMRGKILEIFSWYCGTPAWRVQVIRANGSNGDVCEVHDYMKPILTSFAMSCPRCGGLPAGESSGALDICECEPMHDPFLCWRQKVAVLSATLRQAGTALENAFPIVKAHAVASADEDRFDGLVGEVSRAIEAINQLKL